MLTRIVADRVYDYSHVVGGRQITGLLTLTVGQDDNVFTVVRRQNGGEIVRLTIGSTPGDEELITRFGERGDGSGAVHVARGCGS